MPETVQTPAQPTRVGATRSPVFSALVGLASVAVLLQAVWAGIFIREGKDNDQTWVTVHARGADVAIVLAILAAVYAIARMRARRELVAGSIVFAVLLVVEAYLGGLIGDSPAVEIAHFPIAMGLMALAVWLPLRARARV